MTLTDIPGIGPSLAATLGKDGWTVRKIATTTPAKLAKYRGVSKKTAGEIIKNAMNLVNEAGLGIAYLPGPPPPPPDKSKMSVRIRRMYEMNNEGA